MVVMLAALRVSRATPAALAGAAEGVLLFTNNVFSYHPPLQR